jgi:tetratricopeptide (TPR) repeat protein
VYEAVQDDRASEKYQLAVKGEYYKAYPRLARLYILKGKKDEENYSKAVALLTEGSSKVRKQAPNDKETDYFIRTYMGWARLGQKRYSEANGLLQQAIATNLKLQQDKQHALAHCLLAQVLEEDKELPAASRMWEQCAGKANQTKPDEDAWLGLARQRSEKMEDKL